MTGTFFNATAIVLGGVIGLAGKTTMSARAQAFCKSLLGILLIFFGLRLTWLSLNGTFIHIAKQIAVVVLALALGKFFGRGLRLQKSSNRVGQFARERMTNAKPNDPNRFTTGFLVCSALFCAAPIGVLGAICDGLSGYFYPLAVKAAMEALAAMGFVSLFGAGVLFSAVPVLVLQGSVSLLCAKFALPFLDARHLTDSVNATAGLLIFCVALVIFEIRKVEVTDYLPSLIFAPLLGWWWL